MSTAKPHDEAAVLFLAACQGHCQSVAESFFFFFFSFPVSLESKQGSLSKFFSLLFITPYQILNST